jgi:ribose transport system substrate-binding protein
VPGSGEGIKIGYISLGESIPFVKLVSDSIKEQARIAGAELVFCDSQLDASKALECGQNLKVQNVQGVLNFQAFAASAPEICAAYDGAPTIAIDIEQKPCQRAFMGANNRRAGEIAGAAVGQHLQANHQCEYTAVLTLESPAVGEVNEARTGGMISGFESVCGKIEAADLKRLGVGGTTDAAVTQVSDALSAIEPGGHVVVLSLNDDMALGALAAARTSNRAAELRIGAQGADPSAWKEIACNPNWIADAAYFPERYGTILVPAIIDLIAGKAVPENLFTPHEAVTRDNIRTLYPETPAC